MPAKVRPFTRDDLLPVAALRRRLFRRTTGQTDEQVAEYLDSIFFGNPWARPDMPCHVLEAESGIVGFIGVIPRPMKFQGDLIQGGLLTQLVVEREHRRNGPLRLMEVAADSISGLAVADAATEGVRRLWDSRIGSTAQIYRFFWNQPLWRGKLQGLSVAGSGAARAVRGAVRQAARSADRLLARARGGEALAPPQTGESVPLDIAELMPALCSMSAHYPLHSAFDSCTLAWILNQASAKWGEHAVHARVVREGGAVAGFFVFAVGEGGTAQVLYAMAGPAKRELLAAHLEHSAREAGAVSLEGRYEPVLTPIAEGRSSTFRSMGQGILYRTADRQLRECVSSGSAVLTGLDGEWWLNV